MATSQRESFRRRILGSSRNPDFVQEIKYAASSKVGAEMRFTRRQLFTDRHHALKCPKGNLGRQLLECDYCDCLLHETCTVIARRIKQTQKACDERRILLDMVGIGAHGSNDTIESPHLTLLDRTRAELIQSGEPVATLPYVLLHAARMQNCMPKSGGDVPWTIVHGEPPRFWDCFHSIGAAGVIRILTPKSKTSPRAVKGLYYGHSNESQTVMLIKVQTKDAHGNIAA